MNYLSKSPYVKPTGISLLFHCSLIVCLTMLGPPNLVDKPAEVTAIEVDIAPVAMVETRSTASLASAEAFSSASSPASAQMRRSAPSFAPNTSLTDALLPVMPGEANGNFAGNTDSSGTEGVEQTAAGGNDGGESDAGAERSNNHSESVSTPPKYRSGSKPAYPQTARKAKWEGAVVVRVLVDTDGTVETVAVRAGSGHDVLDEAAVQAVKKWRFYPAKEGDAPVARFHDVRVRFRLDEAE